MKKIKKLLAMIMAMTMVLGMAMTVSAKPSTVTATGTVKGINESDANVIAYQLVYYDESEQTYKLTSTAANLNYEIGSRNAEIVTNIAKNVAEFEPGEIFELEYDGENYSSEKLTAGTYLIIVEGTGATIYNPMLMSLEVKYEEDGTTDGEVDANTNYMVENQVVYAKSTDEVPVNKVIVDEDGNPIGENGKYDDVYAGTDVIFKLSGTIPSYSDAYEDAVYTLTDNLGTGLTIKNEHISTVKETIESQLLDEFADDTFDTIDEIAAVTVNANQITIVFKSDFILAQAAAPDSSFELTYSATVTGDASNFDPATNTLNVTYSRNPGETTDGTSVQTKHYTFDFENVLIKVDSEENSAGNKEPLSGAVFTLTNSEGKVVTSDTTDEDGLIKFSGLDAGVYTLKETKAPTGYQLSGIEYTVTISPSYNVETGDLISYSVKITDADDEIVGNFTYTEANDQDAYEPAEITNTKLASLPSTGGIGTTIFTIGGCAIMIAAAALYFVNRRKSEEN